MEGRKGGRQEKEGWDGNEGRGREEKEGKEGRGREGGRRKWGKKKKRREGKEGREQGLLTKCTMY